MSSNEADLAECGYNSHFISTWPMLHNIFQIVITNHKWNLFIFHLTWERQVGRYIAYTLLPINSTQPWCCLPSTADHPASLHLIQRHSLLPSNSLQHHCPPVSMETESIDPRCVWLGPRRPWPFHLPNSPSVNLNYGTSISKIHLN